VMRRGGTWQRVPGVRRLLTKNWLAGGQGGELGGLRRIPQSSYFDERKRRWDMSGVSRALLKGTRPENIVARRRRNYQFLHSRLSMLHCVRPLYNELPDGVCPLAFPLFVENRDRWEKRLTALGILVGGWPGYHRDFEWEEFPETRNLKDNLLTVPVHQDLDVEHMEYIVDCIEQLGKGQE
ncbi:MAG: hypothetical protein ABIN58_06770, partial [candidate division WOR-3 bacterium]